MERLDWQRIAEWTARITVGDLGPITAAFRGHGATPPEIFVPPAAEQIEHEPLRFLYNHWLKLSGSAPPPHFREIDALQLGPALGYIMLLDVVDGGLDFRYRLFGSKLARISDLDMTGRLLSEHPASPYNIEFSIAVCRVAARERRPVLTSRHPVGTERTATWMRLALPLRDDGGTIVRLLAGTVAIGYDGRMIRG